MSTKLESGTLVIFGITGDLAARMLLPALYHLICDELLPEPFAIVGITRREVAVDAIIERLRTTLAATGAPNAEVLNGLAARITIRQLDESDPAAYQALKAEFDQREETSGVCFNRLFYLAVPPTATGQIVDQLGVSGLNEGCAHEVGVSRLLLEKPFGRDLASAEALINQIKQHFTDDRVYRIDHYLAKETSQNILTFRFDNPLFAPIWDWHSVSSISITAAEAIGVEGRAGFYESTGALRDLIQSHLLQLLALVTMEQPADMTAEAIQEQKLNLLHAVTAPHDQPLAAWAVRGQYRGYRAEADQPTSSVETFAMLRLAINNERWRGVPIFLRTGKRLAQRATEITLTYRDRHQPDRPANTLTLAIAPNEGVGLSLQAKRPGFEAATDTVQMDFCYNRSFSGVAPSAYERVLVDAVKGDQTLFATAAEVLASWRIIEPVIQAWGRNGDGLVEYEPGSWGPPAASALAEAAGAPWLTHQIAVCQVPGLGQPQLKPTLS